MLRSSNKNKGRRGFTLIELLVVIAIIAVLSSIVLANLAKARVAARDARRISDIQQIRRAFELYYSDYGKYPPFGVSNNAYGINIKACDDDYGSPSPNSAVFMTSDEDVFGCDIFRDGGTTWTGLNNILVSPTGKRYISKLPKDPVSNTAYGPTTYGTAQGDYGYAYVVSLDGSTYDLYAKFESTNSNLRCGNQHYKNHVYDWNTDSPPGNSFCDTLGYSNQLYSDRP
jgi:prepilin-type N-terminal cleavage/methylation domain-containing protein